MTYCFEPLWNLLRGLLLSVLGGLAVCGYLVFRIRRRKEAGMAVLLACALVYCGAAGYLAADVHSVIRKEEVFIFEGEFLEKRTSRSGPEYAFVSDGGKRQRVEISRTELDELMGKGFEFEPGVRYRLAISEGLNILVGAEISAGTG